MTAGRTSCNAGRSWPAPDVPRASAPPRGGAAPRRVAAESRRRKRAPSAHRRRPVSARPHVYVTATAAPCASVCCAAAVGRPASLRIRESAAQRGGRAPWLSAPTHHHFAIPPTTEMRADRAAFVHRAARAGRYQPDTARNPCVDRRAQCIRFARALAGSKPWYRSIAYQRRDGISPPSGGHALSTKSIDADLCLRSTTPACGLIGQFGRCAAPRGGFCPGRRRRSCSSWALLLFAASARARRLHFGAVRPRALPPPTNNRLRRWCQRRIGLDMTT